MLCVDISQFLVDKAVMRAGVEQGLRATSQRVG